MFGTVASITVKAGHESALEELLSSPAPREGMAGMSFSYLYRSKDDPRQYWLVSAFESEEAYYTNADRPETNQWFQQLMEHLEAAPAWHDGEVVSAG